MDGGERVEKEEEERGERMVAAIAQFFGSRSREITETGKI